MSECSESYHIYSQDFVKTHKTLTSLGFNGILFKPKNGNRWCTFVPFKSFAFSPDVVFNNLHTPVLTYFYVEDHGWSVQITSSQQALRYDCSWEDKVQILAEEDFVDKIKHCLDIEIDETLKSLLRCTDIKTILHKKPAYLFGQAIGLVYLDWLSPAYIIEDLENYKKRKDSKIVGNVPASILIDQPAIKKIKLTKTNLSAKEAVQLLTPYIKQWAVDVEPDLMGTSRKNNAGLLDLSIDLQGRLTHVGAWCIRYISLSKGVLLWVNLFANGDVYITKALEINQKSPFKHWHLPSNYYDSPDVLKHVLQEYVSENTQALNIRNISMRLREWQNTLAWQVDLNYSSNSSTKINRCTWVVAAHDLHLMWQNKR